MRAAEHMRDPGERGKLLEIAADEPCLLLTRRTWCQGQVVSRARLLHPGRRYRLAGRQEFR